MAATLDSFISLVKKLLPNGPAWESIREDEVGLFPAMVEEFLRIDGRGIDLLREMDPGTSDELLEDWEALLGLPDECTPLAPTLEERRLQARLKLASIGGISKEFYERTALALGFVVYVRDFASFQVGLSSIGDRLHNPFNPNHHLFRVGHNVEQNNHIGCNLVQHGWKFTFEINMEATVNEPFRVSINSIGDPLVIFGNELLECIFLKLKPAHNSIFFTFR
jgi:uncharacterized protein YmfQ (DUF2313 family)